MRFTIWFCILFPLFAHGQTQDSLDSSLPRDLDDAHERLLVLLPDSVVQHMRAGSEANMVSYHFGLGMWMRNYWGLWSRRSHLYWYFDSLGIHSPDEISGFILSTFWRKLNKRPLEIPRLTVISSARADNDANGFPFKKSICPIDSSSLKLMNAIAAANPPYTVQYLLTCSKQGHNWVFEKGRPLYVPSHKSLHDFENPNLQLYPPIDVPRNEVSIPNRQFKR
jgi:hypothetical protein